MSIHCRELLIPAAYRIHLKVYVEKAKLSDIWDSMAEPLRLTVLWNLAGVMVAFRTLRFESNGSPEFDDDSTLAGVEATDSKNGRKESPK